MREDECPVCGETDSFDAEKCQVCGYAIPPDFLRTPDTDEAKAQDLRDEGGVEEDRANPDGGSEIGDGKFEEAPEGGAIPGDDVAANEAMDPAADPAMDPQAQTEQPQDLTDENGQPADSDHKFEEAPTEPGTPPGDQESEPKAEEPKEAPKATDAPKDEGKDESGDKPVDEEKKKDMPTPPKKKSGFTPQQRQAKMRPALAALAEQQEVIDGQKQIIRRQAAQIGRLNRHRQATQQRLAALESAVAYIARLTGKEAHIASIVRASMKRVADTENPAQPWPEPAGTAPDGGTTEEARAADVTVDPSTLQTPGAAGATDVSADASTTVDSIGEDVAVQLTDGGDVTVPVAGTTDAMPVADVRTEVDVQMVTDPDLNPAFPIDPAFSEQMSTAGSKRTMASLRLARLRIATGVEHAAGSDGDLALASQIEASNMSDDQISSEISVLERVRQAAREETAVPRNLVPRAANRTRSTPSFQAAPEVPMPEIMGKPSAEEFLFE